MNAHVTKKRMARVSGRNSAGVATTISMSSGMHARYIREFGGKKQFRKIFNTVLIYAKPCDGFSLSTVVRMGLDAALEGQRKGAAKAAKTAPAAA
jgi:hypothetical protein